MYIDLVINNEVKKMQLGYIVGVHSVINTRNEMYNDKTPVIKKYGTSFRQILQGNKPDKIYTSNNDIFATLHTYDITTCSDFLTIKPHTSDKDQELLSPASGSFHNSTESTSYYYRINMSFLENRYGGNFDCTLNNYINVGENVRSDIKDFMLFATDEIINEKRTIICLTQNKFKISGANQPTCFGKTDAGELTSHQWYNLNYTNMEISFEYYSAPFTNYGEIGLSNQAYNILYYLGTKKQAGGKYRALVATAPQPQYRNFDYGNLVELNERNKYYYYPHFVDGNSTDRWFLYKGVFARNYILNIISDKDNPEPDTPQIPDIPTPEPENPNDPNNPDNIDNLNPEPSDTVPIPTPSPSPTFSAKLITAYKLSIDNLSALAKEMWTSTFYDNVIKMFQNPMDCLVSLSEYPIDVPTGGTQNIQLGNVEMSTAGAVIRNPFVTVDLGTVTITEKYNSYLDYMNTQLIIYLPFIGFEQISIDYMNSQLQLQYNVDILSGNCVAILYAISYNSNLQSVVGQWNGNMAYSIPLSGRDFSNMASSLWNTAMSAGSVIASSRIPAVTASGFTKGSPSGFGAPSLGSVTDLGNNIINTIEAANATTSGGHLSANAGHLGVLQPYVIISRPVQKINANYYASYGRILDAYTSFSTLSGFTKVKSCNLFIAGATVDEVREIERLLKEGVIF